MLWIIQLPNKLETEIWSDEKLEMMHEKCLFYGAMPHWVTIRSLNDCLDKPKAIEKNAKVVGMWQAV